MNRNIKSFKTYSSNTSNSMKKPKFKMRDPFKEIGKNIKHKYYIEVATEDSDYAYSIYMNSTFLASIDVNKELTVYASSDLNQIVALKLKFGKYRVPIKNTNI